MMVNGKTLLVIAAVGFTAAGGLGASAILGASGGAPTETVTISVATGPAGPRGEPGPKGDTGPPGPPGPAGAFNCPDGYHPAEVVIDHPGGHLTMLTCLKS